MFQSVIISAGQGRFGQPVVDQSGKDQRPGARSLGKTAQGALPRDAADFWEFQ
jgi:hypothetical protein